jgi:hypothetical protein
VRRCELDIPQGIFSLHLSQLDQPKTEPGAAALRMRLQ